MRFASAVSTILIGHERRSVWCDAVEKRALVGHLQRGQWCALETASTFQPLRTNHEKMGARRRKQPRKLAEGMRRAARGAKRWGVVVFWGGNGC